MALRVKVGTYTGTGAVLSVTGFGFQPKFLVLKGDAATNAFYKTDQEAANEYGKMSGGITSSANYIRTLDADGFTLGNSTDLNNSGVTYYYFAFGGTSVVTGNYTGDGGTNRDLSVTTFTPCYVHSARYTVAVAPKWKCNNTSANAQNWDQQAGTNLIPQINADGFRVTGNQNLNTYVYRYVCIEKIAGQSNCGNYTGNGADNRNITGLGFDPILVLNKLDGRNNSENRVGVFRTTDHVGDSSCYCDAATANAANLIQSFITDGFQVGSDGNVNLNNDVQYWVAFKDGVTGPSGVKTINGVDAASVKTINGVDIASVKTINS